ncbi:MAG: sulfotransferase [Chloroflexota bacterium]|nr:sulfotransferase [Chloroflexota bacterium]
MSDLERPIFVVGCARSGTTLVQCILSASSQAYSLPETHFFSSVLPALDMQPSTPLSGPDLRRLLGVLDAEAGLTISAEVLAALEAGAPPTARDVFVALVDQFRPPSLALRAIEKTPLHVLHLETIAACFPDARFVNVVRDPIDVISSLLSVPFSSSRSVLSQAQLWTECVLAARRFSGPIHTLLYEVLVQQPEATTRELCAFLDLPFEPAMLEEFGREASRIVGRAEPWKRDVERGVLLNRQGVWRERLSPGQAFLAARVTRELRTHFGFDQPVQAPPGSVVAAALGEGRVRFREARATDGLLGAARHAGSVLKALAAA